MQQRINVNKPLRVKAIYFKGNTEPLEDKVIWIASNFLVVAHDESDAAPTWFNVDNVDRLEGVEVIPTKPKQQQIVFL